MNSFALNNPENPLGIVSWPEFTNVFDDDQSMLTRAYTALHRLNRLYESKPDKFGRPFLINAPSVVPQEYTGVDLDNLYILARTGRLEFARGLGEKTLGLVTSLINEQIETSHEKVIV